MDGIRHSSSAVVVSRFGIVWVCLLYLAPLLHQATTAHNSQWPAAHRGEGSAQGAPKNCLQHYDGDLSKAARLDVISRGE